jgi:tetratricopeptide (TPR) repeat protein
MTPQQSSQPAGGPMPHSRPAPSGHAGMVLGIFAVSLVARGVVLLQLRASPFFPFYIGDAKGYHEWARRIATGDWVGQEVFYQAPLYPYFLGALYALGSDDLLFVRACQAVIGSLGCVLIADTARRLFSLKAGLLAGLMMALYPPAIFFDGLIQKSVLDLFFLALALWLIVGAIRQERKTPWFLAGLAIGALVLCRENALVFVFAILLWLVFTSRRRARRHLAFAVLFVAGLAAVLAPVALRNRLVGGGFYLTTSQFGPNFYIGNNEAADGTYSPLRPGRGNVKYERKDATELAQEALGRELSPSEVSRYWTGRALAYIQKHPSDWLALMLTKWWLVWNAIELEDSEDLYTYAGWSPPLWLLTRGWHFGILAPLAAWGLVVTWRDRRRLWLLYGMATAYAVGVAAFYVFGRYRYPLVPFLVLFAAGGLAGTVPFLRSARRRTVGAAVGVAVAMAVFSNWPTPFEKNLGAATRYSVANHLHRADRVDEAERFYREALEINPNLAPAHTNLAEILRSSGRIDEAIDHYRATLRIQQSQGNPVDASVHYDLGLAYLDRRQAQRAREQLAIAMAKNPSWPGPVNASAWLLATDPDPSVRRPEEAVRLAELANRLSGEQSPSVLDTLAAAYAAAGRFAEAQQTARRALALVDASGSATLGDPIRQRLALYERSRSFVRPLPGASP